MSVNCSIAQETVSNDGMQYLFNAYEDQVENEWYGSNYTVKIDANVPKISRDKGLSDLLEAYVATSNAYNNDNIRYFVENSHQNRRAQHLGAKSCLAPLEIFVISYYTFFIPLFCRCSHSNSYKLLRLLMIQVEFFKNVCL